MLEQTMLVHIVMTKVMERVNIEHKLFKSAGNDKVVYNE